MSQLYFNIKANYEKLNKVNKNLKQHKLLSDEYENITQFEISNSLNGIEPKYAYTFNFFNVDISSIFKSNIRHIDYQLKGSTSYNDLIKSVS